MAPMALAEKVQNMLDELPDTAHDQMRPHTLSKHDARWLANLALVISEHQECNHKFSDEQVVAFKGFTVNELNDMKDMVKERKRILVLLGTIITGMLIYIAQKALDLLDPHFWKNIFHL